MCACYVSDASNSLCFANEPARLHSWSSAMCVDSLIRKRGRRRSSGQNDIVAVFWQFLRQQHCRLENRTIPTLILILTFLRLVDLPPARSCGLMFSTLNFAARSRMVLNTSSSAGGSPLIHLSGLNARHHKRAQI